MEHNNQLRKTLYDVLEVIASFFFGIPYYSAVKIGLGSWPALSINTVTGITKYDELFRLKPKNPT
jgi:hypothetical protein